ncbi:MAG TPA: aromatic-ring-hydroxylating dioxygenase subunit beta [Usitatibacter sp.]|nr:aromatic-ring-hydroxylating dioxygenase subunit beta [Usitatibacter sp.]
MTRSEVEDFLYHEAALLDEWRLDEWLALLTDDARYQVPSNDAPMGDPKDTLFLIADDMQRIRGRVARLKDPHAHAEFPHSRTRRIVTNVRVESVPGSNYFLAHANFIIHRFRRGGQESQFVGRYRYRLRMVEGQPKIAMREAILDPEELGRLGAVSFIL